ncbi:MULTISPECIES: ABC transporter permease [unclassified Chelatococcus]|uniref:ABC transporter permease n=1 Tax=unclassified Chelatococcus TaxID=2638111 RepID=UPI001BD08B8D|nr:MULTISPECIES: ABC transporter permease [unclassified Chelatococcus]MBS7700359.1 ABC transporter permease [Chelatococcus sp. YT9]MBX3556155.1 ABC transporter permease [Chelatococcus sp.]
MLTYLVRRIMQWIPVLLVSSVIVFAVVRALPGDPADVIAGPDALPEVVEQIRLEYGLDRSLPEQYFSWLGQIVRGNFGESYIYHRENSELIFSRIPYSMLIAISALVIALLIGIPTGLAAGLNQGKTADWVASAASAFSIATPDFWFGILMILVFSVSLGWLPPGGFISGFDSPSGFALALILPSLTLALHGTAVLTRFTRNAVIEILGEDYVRTAYAKGLAGRAVVVRHVLRNSLIPVITMTGIMLGRMLGGAVVIESVFAWPGVGRLLVQSIINRDYGVVQGILVLLVLFFLVLNLVVDLIYGAVDPRIRLVRETAR